MADGLGIEDGAATLTAFTTGAGGQGAGPVAAAAGAADRLRRWAAQSDDHGDAGDAGRVEAVPAEAVGWRGDAIEAEVALLAVRVMRGLPISFPTTTGAPRPLTGQAAAAV